MALAGEEIVEVTKRLSGLCHKASLLRQSALALRSALDFEFSNFNQTRNRNTEYQKALIHDMSAILEHPAASLMHILQARHSELQQNLVLEEQHLGRLRQKEKELSLVDRKLEKQDARIDRAVN